MNSRLSDDHVSEVFKLIQKAVVDEDSRLRSRFRECGAHQHFDKLHHGIFHVREAPIVYIAYRDLLQACCPVEMQWERPFRSPLGNQSLDLAFVDDRDRLTGVVEVKLFHGPLSPDDRICRDVNNMRALGSDVRKFSLLLWLERQPARAYQSLRTCGGELAVKTPPAWVPETRDEWTAEFPTSYWDNGQVDRFGAIGLLEIRES